VKEIGSHKGLSNSTVARAMIGPVRRNCPSRQRRLGGDRIFLTLANYTQERR
jgi:hypothetical protein